MVEISRLHQEKSDIESANIYLVLHRNKAGEMKPNIWVVCMCVSVCVCVSVCLCTGGRSTGLCGRGFMHTHMELAQVVASNCKKLFCLSLS